MYECIFMTSDTRDERICGMENEFSVYFDLCVNIDKRILIVYNAGSKIWEYIEYITKKEKNREIYICIRICIDIPLI